MTILQKSRPSLALAIAALSLGSFAPGLSSARAEAPAAEVAAEPPKEEVPAPGTLLPPPAQGEEALRGVWEERARAIEMHQSRAIIEAEERLLALRQDLGFENLFAYASALCVESVRLFRVDPAEAVRRAGLATRVAPDLPHAHWTLARATWNEDFVHLDRPFKAAWAAIKVTAAEPRWSSVALFNLVLVSSVALGIAASLLLLLIAAGVARNVLHDVTHRMPRRSWLWQSALLLALLLPMPLLFGMGPFSLFAFVTVAIWYYARRSERVLLAVLLLFVSALPYFVWLGAKGTNFAGSDAETVYLAERGGYEGQAQREALSRLRDRPDPPFEVAFAIGRRARRLGNASEGARWLRLAAESRPRSPAVLIELGHALFMLGDLEGANDAWSRVAEGGEGKAQALFNLSRFHTLRSKGQLSVEEASAARTKGSDFARALSAIDPALALELDRTESLATNRFFRAMPLGLEEVRNLTRDDEAARELLRWSGRALFGSLIPMGLWPFQGFALVALLLLCGLMVFRSMPSSSCTKCGRAVCVRCDEEVTGAGLCGQCIHVFLRPNKVDPSVRGKKEGQIRRYQAWRDTRFTVVSLLIPGSGQVLLGRPFSGAVRLLVVTLLLVGVFFPERLWLRPPVGEIPLPVYAIPALLLALSVHLLSARSARSELKQTIR